nr:hypothetical protein [Massilia sp. JS1662]
MTTQAPLRVRVTAKAREAQDIASFEFTALDGEPLPPFSAGSHIDVELRPGLVRQYSLCNDPSERHRYLIAVLRDPQSRGGSRGMHDNIQVPRCPSAPQRTTLRWRRPNATCCWPAASG